VAGFEVTRDTEGQLTRAVFEPLANRITAGEIEDVRAELPDEIAELWPASCAAE
jgi:uncharacterized protein (DUF2267 family)